MKLRTHIITEGDYSSYRIKCLLIGPVRPAISTLYKEFCTAYGYPDKAEEVYRGMDYDPAIFHLWYDSLMTAAARMKADLGSGDCADAFIIWLKRDHGFIIDQGTREFHV